MVWMQDGLQHLKSWLGFTTRSGKHHYHPIVCWTLPLFHINTVFKTCVLQNVRQNLILQTTQPCTECMEANIANYAMQLPWNHNTCTTMSATACQEQIMAGWRFNNFFSLKPPSFGIESEVKMKTVNFSKQAVASFMATNALDVFVKTCKSMNSEHLRLKQNAHHSLARVLG